MAENILPTFNLKKDEYVAFDAMSLRQLILNRLNEQNVFTDQNFLGSNLASIIDIIAYSYHTLIYYLNKTSSESMFTEADLYENINRIVKLIDYSPIGFQTSTLSFNCSAGTLNRGVYTIPRYSYVLSNNIPYSFNEDITFVKSSIDLEFLSEISEQKLLYQGLYKEYPLYTAAGDDNEVLILNTGNDLIDHFNIDVYVKPVITGKWTQYTKTSNLFLEDGFAKKFEIRLNQNKRYELKFGNDINGVKLQEGDQVIVYYLTSSGKDGEVGPGALIPNTDRTRLIKFNTTTYNQILEDVYDIQISFLETSQMSNLFFNNTIGSTVVKEAETVEEIKKTAPSSFRGQYRLITTQDYETFINANFNTFISDVKCVNNWDYVATYLRYFYDIGLTKPTQTERALYNQVTFADSCNFNNIYLILVPRSATGTYNYLLPAQKTAITTAISTGKVATTETVFLDPVYKAISLGISPSLTTLNPILDEDICRLEVIKSVTSRRNDDSIINDIVDVFRNYFNKENNRLGETVDTRLITQQVLGVEGVRTCFTTRTDDPTVRTEGISFFCWNPIYPNNDKQVSTNNIPLKYFEFPFFNNLELLASKINIISDTTILQNREY